MQGHLMMLGERFFPPRYFGRRMFGLAIPAVQSVEVAPALRAIVVPEVGSAPGGMEDSRSVIVRSVIRLVAVAPMIRSVIAEDEERVA